MVQDEAPPGRKFVLVVEDEPLLLLMAGDIVGDAGLEAILVPNADEAICILESRDDISIVFTDVRMPGSMDGIRLAAAVRGRRSSFSSCRAISRRTPTCRRARGSSGNPTRLTR
jgi:CheY-like chemotaxis protein